MVPDNQGSELFQLLSIFLSAPNPTFYTLFCDALAELLNFHFFSATRISVRFFQ